MADATKDAAKDEDVMDLLDSLNTKPSQKTKPKKASARKKEANQKEAAQKKAAGDDILGFLDELKLDNTDAQKAKTEDESRPAPGALAEGDAAAAAQSTEPDAAATTAPQQSEEDRAAEEPNVIDPVASISSWWSRNKGGLWGAATGAANRAQDALQDAVQQARQAEARVREDQPQFSLNSLQSRLTSVLNTIVPPIRRHEQLKIHIFHDMVGYPSIDKLLYEVFDYVMDQVEGGGDLNLVVQKGKERHRAGSDYDVHRSLNYARCTLEDGVKLAKANVEEVRRESAPAKGDAASQDGSPDAAPDAAPGAAQDAAPDANENPNIHISEVFVSIQPVLTPGEPTGLIAPSTQSLYFVVYLSDFDHEIEVSTASQAFPAEWAQWLEGSNTEFQEAAIDPREWVSGWLEDGLNLAFGILAQKYVTTRMGLTKGSAAA